MDRPFVAENSRERERLRALVARSSDEDLNLKLGEGWTIAAALAHLAFWDQRALVLMKRWKQEGVAPSLMDTDAVNDALLPLCLVVPPRVAANLAITAAEAIDQELEQASPELISEIERLKDRFRLWRSAHRRVHLDEIEAILSSRGRGSNT